MRVNIYSQELTDEVDVVTKESNTGRVYSAIRLILHSSDKLHHPPEDDDRSGVTFWLPRRSKRRERLALTFEKMAKMVREAPKENPGKIVYQHSEDSTVTLVLLPAHQELLVSLLNKATPKGYTEKAFWGTLINMCSGGSK